MSSASEYFPLSVWKEYVWHREDGMTHGEVYLNMDLDSVMAGKLIGAYRECCDS